MTAQDISIYAGYSKALYDKRFYPALFGENVSPAFPTVDVKLGLQAQYAVSPRFDVGIGLFFNHHSNGALSFPNYGINSFELATHVGMKAPRSEEDLYLGVVLKAHRFRAAESVQLCLGKRF